MSLVDTKTSQIEFVAADEAKCQYDYTAEPHTKEPIPQEVTSKYSLPDLLPLEYLNDDEDPQIQSSTSKLPVARPRKIKFDVLEQKIKDRRVGNTTYRVCKASSKSLAPKAALNARKIKEAWLQGRRGKKLESCRKAFINKFIQS